MNIGLSNFAFDKVDIDLLKELPNLGINNIELVYTKYNKWTDDYSDVKNIKDFFSNLNLNVNSIQSIFYDSNINSFSQEIEIKKHLNKLFNICKKIGIKKIVFGSPNFRKSFYENEKFIMNIFDFIENELKNTSIKFLIEPNSKIYNTEYFNNPYEIISFINCNEYENISTMIDTHNLLLDGFNPFRLLDYHHNMIDHIHISEYTLSALKDINFHLKFSNKLKELKYDGLIIFEIFKNENILENIKQFSNIYN